jgi:hypothetical protein
MSDITFACVKNPKGVEVLTLLQKCNNKNDKYESIDFHTDTQHIDSQHDVCELQERINNSVIVSFGYTINIMKSYKYTCKEYVNLKTLYKEKLNIGPNEILNRWQMTDRLGIETVERFGKTRSYSGRSTCLAYQQIYDALPTNI